MAPVPGRGTLKSLVAHTQNLFLDPLKIAQNYERTKWAILFFAVCVCVCVGRVCACV